MDKSEEITPQVTEEDVVLNSKLEHLYNLDFGEGRFSKSFFLMIMRQI